MSKKVIFAIIITIVVAGGVAAFFRVSSQKNAPSNEKNTQLVNDESSDITEVFDAATTNGLDFIATLTTTEGDKTYTGMMKQDADNGNTSYQVDIDGKQALTIYTKDAYYFCQNVDDCIKYPLNQIGANNFDPETYLYTDEEITSYRDDASYEGVKQCGAKNCNTWKIMKDGLETVLYIDDDSKRIVQVEGTTPNGAVKIVYEYQDVEITPPENAKTIPNFQ